MTERKMTPAQNRKLHATAMRASLTDDELHELVYFLTGKESLKELTVGDAKEVIDRMLSVLGEKDENPGRASDAQLEYIDVLLRAIGWNREPRRFRGFLRAQYGVDDIHFLPRFRCRRSSRHSRACRSAAIAATQARTTERKVPYDEETQKSKQ